MDLGTLLQIEEEIERTRVEEKQARLMAMALLDANAPEKDVSYAKARETSATRRKARLLMQLRELQTQNARAPH
jgi:hypothetical protein